MSFPPTTNILAQDFEKLVIAKIKAKEKSKEGSKIIV